MRSIFKHLPSANSTETLLEQVVQPATSSFEESGAFHQIDPSATSLYGDSPLLLRHTLDGIDITDAYYDGSAAFRVPYLALAGLSISHIESAQTARNQINYELVSPNQLKPRLQMAGSISGVGDIFPLAIPLMDQFSGTHPRQRTPPPPTQRRRLLEHRVVGAVAHTNAGGLEMDHFIEATLGERRFLSFQQSDHKSTTPTQYGVADEPFAIATYMMRLRPPDNAFSGYLAVEYRHRERAFAERYFNLAPQHDESARQDKVTAFGGFSWGKLKLGTTISWMQLQAREPRFTRELIDIDGESLRPFYPSGHHLLWHSTVRYERPIALTNWFVENDSFIDATMPERQAWSHQLTYQGQPVGRVDMAASYTMQWRQNLRLGLRDKIERDWLTLSYDAYVYSTLTFNGALKNTVSWLDLGAHLCATFYPTTWLSLYAGFAKTPTETTAQMARALDPRAMGGRIRTLQGDTIDSFGGKFISVEDDRLQPPNVLALYSGFDVRPMPWLAVRGQAFVKQYDATPWLSFRDQAGSGTLSSDEYFVLSRGDKYTSLRSINHEPTFTPGVTFQVAASDDERFFFSVAFTGYVSIGRTPFGIGPNANDPFIIDASTANPNNNRQGLANVEADRAYVGKLLFATRIVSTLWLSTTLRYHDGQPFAFYEYAQKGDQVSVRYATPRGSLYKMDGPREDAHIGMDARVSYDLSSHDLPLALSITGSNLFDLGNTIQERSTERVTQGRAALDTQPPRSLFFAIELFL